MGNKSFDKDKGDNNNSDNYVKVVQGDITQGVVDGDIYMKPSKGIIHVAYNDHGSKDTVDLLDSLQNTVENFLVLNGFSVGISDLIADEETNNTIRAKIQERKKQVEQVILQVHLDLFDNNTGKTNQQEFEDQIFGILNQATSDAGSAGQQSLSSENRLLAMVRSGSKGEPLNVAQMMACLGQQAIEGKRVPYGFTDRTLPHYKKYDDSSEARGFIESSFIRGLTPQQFFFHAMSGREGLIDTAVKTADTGYIQRQLIKSMEDLTVQHDGTVRDTNNNIIQFHYGEDGINPTKIENQSYPIGKLSHAAIQTEFGMRNVDWSTILKDGVVRENETGLLAEYVEELIHDQFMMVEEVYQKKSLDGGSVFAPVNLARWILNIKNRFALKKEEKTDLTPKMVLDGIRKVMERTHPHHKIWCALLRFHLAPHKLIIEERFTKDAFEVLMELIVVSHMKSWVQPGDQVGIVAAQSIGEPATTNVLTADSVMAPPTADNEGGTVTADAAAITPDKKVRGWLTEDGLAPNGLPVQSGISFPTEPNEGDYCLRVDYLPNRLFRYDGRRWVKIEDNVRTSLTPGANNKTQRSSFVNNTDANYSNPIGWDIIKVANVYTPPANAHTVSFSIGNTRVITKTIYASTYGVKTKLNGISITNTIANTTGNLSFTISNTLATDDLLEYTVYANVTYHRQSLSDALRPMADN